MELLVICYAKLRLDRLLILLHDCNEAKSLLHALLVDLRLRMTNQYAMRVTNSILPITEG